VRGFYLARHLSRAGLSAEFRQLPLSGFACKVLICSEYQCERDWFERKLAGPFSDIRADRWFCLVDASLHGRPDHFSYEICQWFASRGGVLCHMSELLREPAPRSGYKRLRSTGWDALPSSSRRVQSQSWSALTKSPISESLCNSCG